MSGKDGKGDPQDLARPQRLFPVEAATREHIQRQLIGTLQQIRDGEKQLTAITKEKRDHLNRLKQEVNVLLHQIEEMA